MRGGVADVGRERRFPVSLEDTLDELLAALEGRFPRHLVPAIPFPEHRRAKPVRIVVEGGQSDPRRDAEMGFTQAAAQALRVALEAAEVVLLEPWMRFEIQSPGEFASGILADLNARRAEVEDVTSEGAFRPRAWMRYWRWKGRNGPLEWGCF